MLAGFAISNHVIAIRTAASPMDCAMECAAVEDCLSYNFNNSKNIENNCQLNNATKDSSLPSDYGEAEGLVYYQANLVVNNTLTVKGYGAATVKTHTLKNLSLTCSYTDNLFYNFTSMVRYLQRFFSFFLEKKKTFKALVILKLGSWLIRIKFRASAQIETRAQAILFKTVKSVP